jgi:hypothetical protein
LGSELLPGAAKFFKKLKFFVVKKCRNFDDFSIADFVDLMSNKLGLDDEGTEPDWMVWNFTYSQVEPLGWPTAP